MASCRSRASLSPAADCSCSAFIRFSASACMRVRSASISACSSFTRASALAFSASDSSALGARPNILPRSVGRRVRPPAPSAVGGAAALSASLPSVDARRDPSAAVAAAAPPSAAAASLPPLPAAAAAAAAAPPLLAAAPASSSWTGPSSSALRSSSIASHHSRHSSSVEARRTTSPPSEAGRESASDRSATLRRMPVTSRSQMRAPCVRMVNLPGRLGKSHSASRYPDEDTRACAAEAKYTRARGVSTK
mmetsp:Transcript_17043/g.64525  ORF Transcript_17043/g.64525 Transcript_17043/m.64525 type:complete len:250 (+) Transcript_17043:646-1395(+)